MPQTSGLAAESTQQQQSQQQEKTYRSTSDWGDEVEDPDFKALTRQEAQTLAIKYPSISPWRVVAVQAVTGVAVALLWWVFTGQGSKGWSALSGAAAVVLPNALMAWGMTGLSRGIPGAEVLGFMFWELIKIMTAVAMLAATAVWMPDLSWPALLVALVGCLKVNWLTLFWQGRLNKVKRDGI
ncbi:ATP synthase subunit I [Roseateles koreensis]|uniref:ATP synthase subunit I n=1 Tax=Roseateles koreensis TaxID=2987526 RepID=A0ABT5KT52_9BURK|nr:ATP synthase subunit I [Roseateles koreensis]MDC8784957.1 ATP synthase subunit I [Roseateles koreensis]